MNWRSVLGEEEYNKYYKFTIVRNPYNKFLSMKKFENGLNIIDMEAWRYRQDIFIQDEKGNIIVDDIFFYEDLEKSWLKICERLKIKKSKIIHKNNTKDINVNLTIDEKSWIAKNLLSDFIKFGYDV